MKYIKYFEEKALYESYINSDEAILPNVSYIEGEDNMSYNAKIIIERKNNVIRYYSDQKGRFDEYNLMPSIISHEFNNGVGTITFSDDVTRIGQYFCGYVGFAVNENITKIELPESVVRIERRSLNYLDSLKSINLTNVIYIDELAFQGCVSLTDITINANCEFIGFCTFSESGVSVINYEGTMEQFLMMKKSPNWYKRAGGSYGEIDGQQIFTVRCSDGDIDVSEVYDEGYYDEGYDEGYYDE